MIDGYAFIDKYFRPQAISVINEPLTKVDIVRRGWASFPARVMDDPSTEGFKGPNYSTTAEAEGEVAAGRAFKIGKWFYGLNYGGTAYHSSKYEEPYWRKDGTTNPFVLDIIMSSLSAPTLDVPHAPYRFRWTTTGGEKIDVTVWSFNREGNHHKIAGRYIEVFEYSKLPGVGYIYPPEHLELLSSPDPNGGIPYDVIYTKEEGIFHPQIIINFPNCELGANTCARFELVTETEKVPFIAPNGEVDYGEKYTSCGLRFTDFLFPQEVRRLPMPRFQPRTATDAVSCYVMDRQSVKNFIEKLYTKDIYDKIKNMLYGDGAGNILSLKWFYGIRPAISTPQKRKITLGNVILDLSVPVFAGDFTQVYMGKVFVGGVFGDYRDYTNVRFQVYVPMVGMVDLDPSKVVGKNLHLIYTVNLTDGSAIVTLSTTTVNETFEKQNGWYETSNIVFATSITYGYEIPLNVDSIRSASLLVGEVVAKSIVGGAVGAIAGNIPGAVLGAIGGAATAADGVQTTYSSGSLSPNSNVMGDFKPKLYRTFNEDASGNISDAVGRPSGKVVKVGDASGYLKAAMVYGTPSTTMQHADEIINMLKEGIYIS